MISTLVRPIKHLSLYRICAAAQKLYRYLWNLNRSGWVIKYHTKWRKLDIWYWLYPRQPKIAANPIVMPAMMDIPFSFHHSLIASTCSSSVLYVSATLFLRGYSSKLLKTASAKGAHYNVRFEIVESGKGIFDEKLVLNQIFQESFKFFTVHRALWLIVTEVFYSKAVIRDLIITQN